MPADIKLRPALMSDLEDIVAIYNFAVAEGNSTCDVSPVPAEQWRDWLASHIGSRRPVWVAENTAESRKGAIGYLALSYFMNERPGYFRTSDMGVYIHPQYQGKGVGSLLLDFAINQASALGIDTFATTAFAHNTGSVRLFQKFGFERWGYFPKVAKVRNQDFDLIMLGIHLSPPAN
ncbi:N-acetyltransferase family protein [Pseudomonas sp. BN102]|uniref:GNAT family N-acetyltransferase n=1 Tax=Pseudomonas sp. BN102 TaxID=2567886 RepID=UPI002454D05B|nr:N-acetyltransferase family protein [Pseudomonas sp. BN102]MDH4609321.1 N-acetyltransferase [Pseudomonas sp. BN102]